MRQVITAALAIAIGVGGVLALFWALNALVERLPLRWENRLKPYVFIGPALAVVGLFLVFPALDTIRRSFQDAASQNWIGFENYKYLVTKPILSAIWNNIMWIVIVPAVSVAFGLAVAVLADRLTPRWENI